MQFGYMIPGHGFKGKQHPLENNDDIIRMYEIYKGKNPPIKLWVKIKGCARKRLVELSDNADSPKRPKLDDPAPP